MSLINIITTILLFTINTFFIWKSNSHKTYKEAVRLYYLPLLMELSAIHIKICKEMEQHSLSCIFEHNYTNEPRKKSARENIIKIYYTSFIKFYESLPKYLYNSDIDVEVANAYLHMVVIVSAHGHENSLSDFISNHKKSYPEPNYVQICESISKYAKESNRSIVAEYIDKKLFQTLKYATLFFLITFFIGSLASYILLNNSAYEYNTYVQLGNIALICLVMTMIFTVLKVIINLLANKFYPSTT